MSDLLGLDETSLAAYRLWLRQEDMTTEDVSAALGQPPSIIQRARDRLVELSLLVQSREKPGHLIAVHPEVPLEQLLRQQHGQLIRRQEQLIRHEAQLIRARMQLSTLVDDYEQGRQVMGSGAQVERLDNAEAVQAALTKLVTRAEREVLALHIGPGPGPTATAASTQAVLRALDHGVAMRSVYSRTAWSDDATAAYARTTAAHGLDLRLADALPAGITTVDQRIGLVLLAPDASEGHALLLRDAALTDLVIKLFDQAWETAEPIDPQGLEKAAANHNAHDPDARNSDDPEPADQEPSDQERMLLQLLSLGAKDEAAARHLGVSVRTVRRMIADLMRRMDARSRFQAGILAAERGWL